VGTPQDMVRRALLLGFLLQLRCSEAIVSLAPAPAFMVAAAPAAVAPAAPAISGLPGDLGPTTVAVTLVGPPAAAPAAAGAGVAAAPPAAAVPEPPTPHPMAAAVGDTVAQWKPHVANSVGTLRGSLDSLEKRVATLHNFGKQVPIGEKAVDSFYDLAVNATNRLQKSIGLPPGPITVPPTQAPVVIAMSPAGLSPAPAFAPAPAPGPIFAPAPAEAKSKCDLVYDAEYKRQMDMGRSNERAKKEATAARDRCLGINSKSRKGETQWWAIAIVVGGVLAFIIAGGIVHYRNS